jgi:hypothetical protein
VGLRIRASYVAVGLAAAIAVISSCSTNTGGGGFGPDGGGGSGGSNGGSGGFGAGGSAAGGSVTGGSAAGGSGAGGFGAGGNAGGEGGVVCPDAAAPVPCSATVSAGAIPLSSNFLTAGAAGTKLGGALGYAYFYNDSMNGVGGTSTSCLDSTALCTVGMTDISNVTGSFYGAGIGFNLNQAQSTSCTSTPINSFTVPTSDGISYTLSNLPPGGARLIIGNAVTTNGVSTGTDYCAPLPSASGTIPWAQFNSECWTDTGTFLTAAPPGPIHINIGLPSGTTANSFDFCVESIGFAGSVTTQDSGTSSACNGSACCEPSAGPSASGDGSLTCYTFAQGTPGDKTYCGYQGSETAYTGGGSGACQGTNNTGFTDTVPNVGTNPSYFAAFPGPGGGFGNGTYCGMCVNVTYAGMTLMATVVDECPSGSNPQCGIGSNHLDLSASLARALGYGVGSVVGDPSGVTWAAVACPISSNGGNIVEVFNGGSTQVYFQNVVWPVKTVSVNGTAASQPDGFWQLSAGSGSITLTDIYGHTITGTLPGTNGGSLGVQFPDTCN